MLSRMKLCALLVSLVPFFASVDAGAVDVSEDFAFKISLENHLEKRLKLIITDITGTDKVVIFINADLVSAKGSDSNRGRIIDKKKEDALLLPGVPAKKEFGAGQSESAELLFPGAGGGKYALNKISVSIWLDKSLPESAANLIRDLAKQVVGFDQSRGDSIEVKRIDFETKHYWSSLFIPPNLFFMVLTLLGGFFLVMVARFFMDPFKKLSPAMREIDWNAVRGLASGGTTQRMEIETRNIYNSEVAGKKETAKEEKEAVLPFSFIGERDLPNMAFLLRDKPAQDIAAVASYLDPGLVSKLMEYFREDRQIEIALSLSNEEVNIEKVRALEDSIRSEMNYVVGGESKLVSLLDTSNETVREKVIKHLESKNPDVAKRLKGKVKSFEDIIRELPVQGIQSLYRHLDPAAFAQVLKGSPDDIRSKILGSLSSGAAERLRQEIDLSKPLSPARLGKERLNIMVTIRRMIKDGTLEVGTN